jgi:hypothetical protein
MSRFRDPNGPAQPRELATLLHRVGDVAQHAADLGADAAHGRHGRRSLLVDELDLEEVLQHIDPDHQAPSKN